MLNDEVDNYLGSARMSTTDAEIEVMLVTVLQALRSRERDLVPLPRQRQPRDVEQFQGRDGEVNGAQPPSRMERPSQIERPSRVAEDEESTPTTKMHEAREAAPAETTSITATVSDESSRDRPPSSPQGEASSPGALHSEPAASAISEQPAETTATVSPPEKTATSFMRRWSTWLHTALVHQLVGRTSN